MYNSLEVLSPSSSGSGNTISSIENQWNFFTTNAQLIGIATWRKEIEGHCFLIFFSFIHTLSCRSCICSISTTSEEETSNRERWFDRILSLSSNSCFLYFFILLCILFFFSHDLVHMPSFLLSIFFSYYWQYWKTCTCRHVLHTLFWAVILLHAWCLLCLGVHALKAYGNQFVYLHVYLYVCNSNFPKNQALVNAVQLGTEVLIVLDFWIKALFSSYGTNWSPRTLLWHIQDFAYDSQWISLHLDTQINTTATAAVSETTQ